MTVAEASHTGRIAQLAVGATLSDVSADGREKAKLIVLDTLGVMLAALEFPIGKIVTDYVRDYGGDAGSRVLGTDIRTVAPMAGLANGTLAHGLDFDDHKHLSTHCLPAALVVGETLRSSGAQVLEAYIVGREVGDTLGAIVESKRKHKAGPTYRGWYRVGVVGPVASAVSVGKLLGLDQREMASAIGIAASSSAGLRRNQGTMAKALHSGNGASDGINAAILAQRGFSGDPEILESSLGLVNALCLDGEADWAPLETFGDPFDIEGRMGVKPFPACSPSHIPVSVMLSIIDRHEVRPEDVESIEADLHTFSLMRQDPQEPIATGYSLAFLLAVALVDGEVGLDQVGDDRLHDPVVRELMRRVVHDSEAAPSRDEPERVTVRLKDGRVLREEMLGKPSLQDADSVTAKYVDCASRRLADADVEALRASVIELEMLGDVASLFDLAYRYNG